MVCLRAFSTSTYRSVWCVLLKPERQPSYQPTGEPGREGGCVPLVVFKVAISRSCCLRNMLMRCSSPRPRNTETCNSDRMSSARVSKVAGSTTHQVNKGGDHADVFRHVALEGMAQGQKVVCDVAAVVVKHHCRLWH